MLGRMLSKSSGRILKNSIRLPYPMFLLQEIFRIVYKKKCNFHQHPDHFNTWVRGYTWRSLYAWLMNISPVIRQPHVDKFRSTELRAGQGGGKLLFSAVFLEHLPVFSTTQHPWKWYSLQKVKWCKCSLKIVISLSLNNSGPQMGGM